MLATSTVAFPPDTDRRPPAAPVGATGALANGVFARDTALPTRALLIGVLAAAGPALGDHVVLRQGHGRQQTVEAGTVVARCPTGFLIRSSTGRRSVTYLWSADPPCLSGPRTPQRGPTPCWPSWASACRNHGAGARW